MEKGSTSQQINNPYIDKLLGEKADGSWIACPRYIFQLHRRGIISTPELNLYIVARNLCMPYGYCTINVSALKSYQANKVQIDTINKMLSKLRHLRLVWYRDRQGSGSVFEIHFDDFMLPNNKFTDLQARFDRSQNVPLESVAKVTVSEPTTELDGMNRKFEKPIYTVPTTAIDNMYKKKIGTYNTDMNNDKNKNIDLSISYKKEEYKYKVLVERFIPNSYEETQALKIAKEVGDIGMDGYLSLIGTGNYWALERAYIDYTEVKGKGIKISNPAAYINSIAQKLSIQKTINSIGKTDV